jgi:hypothetical protein
MHFTVGFCNYFAYEIEFHCTDANVTCTALVRNTSSSDSEEEYFRVSGKGLSPSKAYLNMLDEVLVKIKEL